MSDTGISDAVMSDAKSDNGMSEAQPGNLEHAISNRNLRVWIKHADALGLRCVFGARSITGAKPKGNVG